MNFTLIQLLFSALFIVGFKAITRPNHILQIVNKITEAKGENRFVLANVVSECLLCMSSLYGFLSYLAYNKLIVVLDKSSIGLISCLILTTLIEIVLSFRNVSQSRKALYMVKYGAQKCSLSFYSCLLLYTIYINNLYIALAFIIILAGLMFMIEMFLSGIIFIKNIGLAIENNTRIYGIINDKK